MATVESSTTSAADAPALNTHLASASSTAANTPNSSNTSATDVASITLSPRELSTIGPNSAAKIDIQQFIKLLSTPAPTVERVSKNVFQAVPPCRSRCWRVMGTVSALGLPPFPRIYGRLDTHKQSITLSFASEFGQAQLRALKSLQAYLVKEAFSDDEHIEVEHDLTTFHKRTLSRVTHPASLQLAKTTNLVSHCRVTGQTHRILRHGKPELYAHTIHDTIPVLDFTTRCPVQRRLAIADYVAIDFTLHCTPGVSGHPHVFTIIETVFLIQRGNLPTYRW